VHHNGSCVRSLMVLMIGITLFEFYLAAVVVLEFLCSANMHLLEVKEALWDQTQLIFFLY